MRGDRLLCGVTARPLGKPVAHRALMKRLQSSGQGAGGQHPEPSEGKAVACCAMPCCHKGGPPSPTSA
jgi:hypothetical protein